LPPISDTGLVQTKNHGGGFMLIHMDPVSLHFVEFARTSSLPVVDIGAAFGVASIAALKNSTCPVIADDIGVENLLILRNETEEQYRDRLYLNAKRFPQELDFPQESIGGVLVCRVFHVLYGEEIERGLEKIYQWLVPGGKLFIVTSTQYQGIIKEFVPIYEERWANGVTWPGYIEDYGPKAPGLSQNFKPFLHVMDIRPLKKIYEKLCKIASQIRQKSSSSDDSRAGISPATSENFISRAVIRARGSAFCRPKVRYERH
jgi:SAM-dependent methyltransferase